MFGQRLRLARKKAGFSMRELAGCLSPPLSAQAISKYEGGQDDAEFDCAGRSRQDARRFLWTS